MITKPTVTNYHRRVIELRKEGMEYKAIFEVVETENQSAGGNIRYCNFESFKRNHKKYRIRIRKRQEEIIH